MASNTDLSLGRMAPVSTKSLDKTLLNAMLIFFALASNAVRTAFRRQRRSSFVVKSCPPSAHVMKATDSAEDIVLIRFPAGYMR